MNKRIKRKLGIIPKKSHPISLSFKEDHDFDVVKFLLSWVEMTKNIPHPTMMAGVPIENWEVTPDGFKVKMKEKKSEP